MSKRFDGIAIAKDLGQDNGTNSSKMLKVFFMQRILIVLFIMTKTLTN